MFHAQCSTQRQDARRHEADPERPEAVNNCCIT